MVVRNLSQENRVGFLSGRRNVRNRARQNEAKRMGRDCKEEERPRELGEDKKGVERMGRERKGEQKGKWELRRDKQ